MGINLMPVTIDQKEILYNLYQYYLYDFSQYTEEDLDLNGQYNIDLNHYWEDPRWCPYFICHKERIIGFLVILLENYDMDPNPIHVIYDFLILNKYRRKGFGRLAAVKALNLYQANWKIVQMKVNQPAIHFWRDVVSQFTAGKYSEVFREDLNKYVQLFSS
ncbi:GNAT family N-acetyltransferase [Paenibacillus sp. Marseille-Q7038]